MTGHIPHIISTEKGRGAEDVLGWDPEPEAGGSGSEGMGMSTIPTSSNRKTFFFFPLLHPSSERGNMNLEAVALTSPLRPSGPKQGHSDKGQIEDPFLKTLLSWKEDLEELKLGGTGRFAEIATNPLP